MPHSAVVRSGLARRRRSWIGWQFVGPFMAVFTLVFLAPIAFSLYLSLFRNRLVGGNSFVGIENYRLALRRPRVPPHTSRPASDRTACNTWVAVVRTSTSSSNPAPSK